MIFITGDTHGLRDVKKFNTPNFKNNVDKEGNIVIVTGDFGVTWSNRAMLEAIEFYEQFKCTFLFIDGNNENFDILNPQPLSDYAGGKVQRLSKNIIHLMRGEVYTLEGLTFLAFGGATSWDSPELQPLTSRVPHQSWWKEETPTSKEFQHALDNIKAHNGKVDIILTHETTSENVKKYFSWSCKTETTEMLSQIHDLCECKAWFFGHHHRDLQVSHNERCVFNDIISLSELIAEKQTELSAKTETTTATQTDETLPITSSEHETPATPTAPTTLNPLTSSAQTNSLEEQNENLSGSTNNDFTSDD